MISSETLHYPGGSFVIDSLHMAHGSAQVKMSLPLVLAMPEVALVDIGRALSLPVQWEPYTEPSQLAPIPRPIGAPDPARPGYFFTAPGDRSRAAQSGRTLRVSMSKPGCSPLRSSRPIDGRGLRERRKGSLSRRGQSWTARRKAVRLPLPRMPVQPSLRGGCAKRYRMAMEWVTRQANVLAFAHGVGQSSRAEMSFVCDGRPDTVLIRLSPFSCWSDC